MSKQTTIKLSRKMLWNMVHFCELNKCGFIVRIGGVEHGFNAGQLRDLLAEFDNSYSHRIRTGWQYNSTECLTNILNYANTNQVSIFASAKRMLGIRADNDRNIKTIDELACFALRLATENPNSFMNGNIADGQHYMTINRRTILQTAYGL